MNAYFYKSSTNGWCSKSCVCSENKYRHLYLYTLHLNIKFLPQRAQCEYAVKTKKLILFIAAYCELHTKNMNCAEKCAFFMVKPDKTKLKISRDIIKMHFLTRIKDFIIFYHQQLLVCVSMTFPFLWLNRLQGGFLET